MKKQLQVLAKWSRFVGILSLFIGSILALLGYPVFYIGALPGLFIVILSIRLLRASKSAKRLNYNLRFIQTEKNAYDDTLHLFATYFRLQAIILIILVMYFVLMAFFGIYFHIDYTSLIQKQWSHVLPF